MEFYNSIAFITAGAGLAAGLIHIFSGLGRGLNRVDLCFGLLSLSIFIFLVLPPVGFIYHSEAPYSTEMIIKRIFIWSHYMLMPLFFQLYSGYNNRILKYATIGSLLIGYILMVLEIGPGSKPAWLMVSLVSFTLILVYGLLASAKLIKKGNRRHGQWLLLAMAVYGILLTVGMINQLGNNYFGNLLGTKLFFPFHLNLLSFIVVMGIRLRKTVMENLSFERTLRWKEKKWDTLLANMDLFIVELDTKGRIRYLNPFALKELGSKSYEQAADKDWFETYCRKPESEKLRNKFYNAIQAENPGLLEMGNPECREGGARILQWNNVLVYDTNGRLTGTMSIGTDITEQQKRIKEINTLKNELEKENLMLKTATTHHSSHSEIVGQSESLMYSINKAKQVAGTNAGVLLLGDTGTGKEVFANFIHNQSHRKNHPFVKVNCAALPADLIESELFGHEKGAFTGALQTRKGRFELANEGTIFLDEVGELPLSLQPKLLRVLQSGEFERVGGHHTIKVDVRVIAATNRDLQQEVENGKFREDLFYRLNVYPITIASLQKRKEDIPELISHFVQKFALLHNKKFTNISKADMSRLTEYSWPGNIRELINVVERSIISSEGETLRFQWDTRPNELPPDSTVDRNHIESIERTHIMKVLDESLWKINGDDGAAIKLGLHPNTLRSRMKKLNINRKR